MFRLVLPRQVGGKIRAHAAAAPRRCAGPGGRSIRQVQPTPPIRTSHEQPVRSRRPPAAGGRARRRARGLCEPARRLVGPYRQRGRRAPGVGSDQELATWAATGRHASGHPRRLPGRHARVPQQPGRRTRVHDPRGGSVLGPGRDDADLRGPDGNRPEPDRAAAEVARLPRRARLLEVDDRNGGWQGPADLDGPGREPVADRQPGAGHPDQHRALQPLLPPVRALLLRPDVRVDRARPDLPQGGDSWARPRPSWCGTCSRVRRGAWPGWPGVRPPSALG